MLRKYRTLWVVVLSKLRSALTVTAELLGPTIGVRMSETELVMSSSKPSTCELRLSAPTSTPSPAVESTLPAESVTVTSVGSRPSTLDATRCTIACTCSGESVVPGWAWTSTEAVVFCFSEENRSFCGIATCTTAVSTESSASMVLSSSPSIARL